MKFLSLNTSAQRPEWFLAICFIQNMFGIEFPALKGEHKSATIVAGGRVVAELKILVPCTIETSSPDISLTASPGNKHSMRVSGGSVGNQARKRKTDNNYGRDH